MENTKDGISQWLENDPNRKYYVYRLIDPRTYSTFYVGKGCGDRALQHARDVKKLLNNPMLNPNQEEDAFSLKEQQILSILSSGLEVLVIIHRYGLTEPEAFEVEAALIDAYQGLTNDDSGHGADRGVVTREELSKLAFAIPYTEPNDDYIIIKTTISTIMANNGDLYESVRKSWIANIERAKKYKYVLAVVNGIVREVYEVSKWYLFDGGPRIAFDGQPTNNPIQSLKGKRLPNIYMQKGAANPFMYKK